MYSFAQLNGNGYYRVQNYYSTRYIYVMDDYGTVNLTAGTADMYAISTKGGTADAHLFDPACILYINKVGSTNYDFAAQGTSVHKIIGHYLNIESQNYNGETVYQCSATAAGVTLKLSDNYSSSESWPMSILTTRTRKTYPTLAYWYIKQVNSDSDDDYFGIKPDTEAIDGKYYKTFYAAFPFKLKSAGMKAYYINKIDGGNAEMVEFDNDATIPSATPVIIECTSDEPSNNRIDLINGSVAAIEDNMLKGVYFKHDNEGLVIDLQFGDKHVKRTAYDASTMRILGKKADGTLGFITSSTLDYIPANTAYLPVTEGTASELNIVKSTSGIQAIAVDEQVSKQGVYTLQGVKVADDASAIDNLSKGVYVVGGKKVLVK